jgi:DNA repair exonuclease SbcCD ATPase subunit
LALLEKLLQIEVASLGGGESSASAPVGHITFEDVKRAYEKLEAAGVRVSTRKVHEELGWKGSRTTVVKHFAVIHDTRKAAEPTSSPPLSPLLLRELACEVARQVKERTAQLSADLADLRASLELVVEENEGFRAATGDAESRVAALQVALAEKSGAAEVHAAQCESLSTRLDEVHREAESARQATALAREQLRAAQDRVVHLEADSERTRNELADARSECMKARGELESSTRERVSLLAQADAGRHTAASLEQARAKVADRA